jgi:hypothetical protein
MVENGAPEEAIGALALEIKKYCMQISIVGECYVHLLLNPTIVTRLVKSGYFDQAKATHAAEYKDPLFHHEEQGSLTDLGKKVLQNIPNLTVEQQANINRFMTEYETKMDAIKEDRTLLHHKIKGLYDNYTHNKRQPKSWLGSMVPALSNDFPQLLHLVTATEQLKRCVRHEVCVPTQHCKRDMRIVFILCHVRVGSGL